MVVISIEGDTPLEGIGLFGIDIIDMGLGFELTVSFTLSFILSLGGAILVALIDVTILMDGIIRSDLTDLFVLTGLSDGIIVLITSACRTKVDFGFVKKRHA